MIISHIGSAQDDYESTPMTVGAQIAVIVIKGAYFFKYDYDQGTSNQNWSLHSPAILASSASPPHTHKQTSTSAKHKKTCGIQTNLTKKHRSVKGNTKNIWKPKRIPGALRNPPKHQFRFFSADPSTLRKLKYWFSGVIAFFSRFLFFFRFPQYYFVFLVRTVGFLCFVVNVFWVSWRDLLVSLMICVCLGEKYGVRWIGST